MNILMKFNKNHLFIVLGTIFVILFFYLNRHHHLSMVMQSYGSTGFFAAILIMTLMCLTPIPTEGLLLVYFNVYGAIIGIILAWTGYLASTIIIFIIARYIGTNFIRNKVSKHRFETVDGWISEKGITGIMIVRILPIPAFIVNAVLGTMPSISFTRYFVTALIAIMPYYLTSSSLYLGITSSNHKTILIGIAIMIAMWLIGLKFKKANQINNSLDFDQK